MDMYLDTRGVHVHPMHPGWIRPCIRNYLEQCLRCQMMEQILGNMENPSTSLAIFKFAVFVAYLFCVNRMKNKLIFILQSSKLEYY